MVSIEGGELSDAGLERIERSAYTPNGLRTVDVVALVREVRRLRAELKRTEKRLDQEMGGP